MLLCSILALILMQAPDSDVEMDFPGDEIAVDFVETVTIIDLPVKISREGRPHGGVKEKDLELFENGVAVAVESVRRAKIPLKLHFLFDLSTSNERQLMQAKRAVHHVVGKMEKGDTAKISLFSAYYQSLTEYTGDKKALQQRVGLLTPVGSTALYDGIAGALNELSREAGARVLVVLSDGHDFMSKISERELATRLRNHQIPMIFVGFGLKEDEPPLLAAQTRFLKKLADRSGGGSFDSAGDFNRDLAGAFKDMRKRYLVRFSPPDPADRQLWRSLEVRLKNCDNCELEYRRAYQLGH